MVRHFNEMSRGLHIIIYVSSMYDVEIKTLAKGFSSRALFLSLSSLTEITSLLFILHQFEFSSDAMICKYFDSPFMLFYDFQCPLLRETIFLWRIFARSSTWRAILVVFSLLEPA